MKVALIIPFHNRPECLKKCLASLPTSPKGTTVILINDFSTDLLAIEIANTFTLKGAKVELHNMPRNAGIKGVLKYGFDYAFKMHTHVINLDSDCIVADNFWDILDYTGTHQIISGINSTNYDKGKLRNPIISESKNFVEKRHANGQCLALTKLTYKKYIEPALSKPGNWDYNVSELCKSVICVKPSLVQHIGVVSAMGHNIYGEPDVALDFPKIKLPDVTLFGIDAHDPVGIKRAAEICQRHIEFGDVKIITERLFKGREGYSVFCIKEMWKYVKTSHVLIIHADGYIQNPWAWNPDWLQYDYLGAVWDWYNENQNGNGGFTLRSRKLLNIIKDWDITKELIEDDYLCRTMRPVLESKGIKFAPVEVCKKFSIEGYGIKPQYNIYNGEFGFHSYCPQGLPIPPLPKKK